MKFLMSIVSILISTNCLAQYRVKVCQGVTEKVCEKEETPMSHGGEFETLKEAQDWIELNEKPSSIGLSPWGKPERLVPLDGASEEDRFTIGAEVISATEDSPAMLKLPKTYSYTIKDISEQKQAEVAVREAKINRRKQALEKLKEFDDSKSYTAAQLKAFIKAIIEKDVGIQE